MAVLIAPKLLAEDYVPDDYIWHSTSKNSSESMPCGGHDIGMNVWVEGGDLIFYISRSGMFDENNTLLKAGRWRLRLASDPFRDSGGTFSQTLCLNDGAVYIDGEGTGVCLWADVYGLIGRLPEIPLHTIDGDTCIAPAIVWGRIQNEETPQLYPVFPWRIYGIGRQGLDTARNTYFKDSHVLNMRSHVGWKQDNIWASCLGLTDEAVRLNIEKLADGPYRFPAFGDPGFDWAPDCNRGGSGMIGLQEMLLQEAPDDSILLFPAWPKDVDASFKLHASGGRIVEAKIIEGNITYCVTKKKKGELGNK